MTQTNKEQILCFEGKIKKIDNEIIYDISDKSKTLSSISILLNNNYNIIGINLNQLKSTNYGICFKQIIDEIEESMYEIKGMDIEYKLIKFFTCSICQNIVEQPNNCIKCKRFFCKQCIKNDKYSACPNCKNRPFTTEQSENVQKVVSQIFEGGKIIYENLNYNILFQYNLEKLYNDGKILSIIIKKNNDLKNMDIFQKMDLLNKLLKKVSREEFSKLNSKYVHNNILDFAYNLGIIMNDIIEYKNKNSSKDFISEDKAIKYNHDSPYYSCGILSKIIKNSGINVAIERKSSNPQLTNLLLEWISFGFTNLRVLDVHLDLGKDNQEILNDEEKRKDFIKNWIPKIIKGLSINENESQLISLYSGSLGARIAYNQNVPIDPQHVQNLRNENPEITNINFCSLLQSILISPEMFDPYWNNSGTGWAKKGELRGGRKYDPPLDYLGFGIKVSGKYDNGNDDWLGMSNKEGEWWVAYHGVGRCQSNERVGEIVGLIMQNGLIPGSGQVYANSRNLNELNKAEYNLVGVGVYLTDSINEAESYSGNIKIEHAQYSTIFMCRVNPKKVRVARSMPDYFVLDPNNDCIRPYRILIKKN